jgi:photosystem II stability/assembly factor-like uncharacterized protein
MVSSTVGFNFPLWSIAYTTDGGRQWQNVTPHGVELTVPTGAASISIPSPNVVWILSGNAKASNLITTRLYLTTSAGHHWTVRPFFSSSVSYISALNGRQAFVMTMRGVAAGPQAVSIYRTEDAGRTWHLVARTGRRGRRSFPYQGGKTGLFFASPQDGVLTGYDAAGHAWVYATHDGGRRWAPSHLVMPPELQGQPVTFGPVAFFGRRGRGVLIASVFGFPTVIYQTTDGGRRWSLAGAMPYPAGAASQTVDIASQEDLWAVVNVSPTEQPETALMRSTNGGRTWHRVPGSLPGLVLSLDFINGSIGYANVVGGDIWTTTDGGAHWFNLGS